MSLPSLWLRIPLITLLVGGGFMGLSVTLAACFTETVTPAVRLIYAAFTVLYLFVLVAGLLVVAKPTSRVPAVLALLLQIPILTTTAFTYIFTAGGLFGTVIRYEYGSIGLGFPAQFGCRWYFAIASSSQSVIGVNWVPIVFIVWIAGSYARSKRPLEI